MNAGTDAGVNVTADPFSRLVGQNRVVEQARRAVADPEGRSMTHAWLITGPAGSGRSTLAIAFAAALEAEGARIEERTGSDPGAGADGERSPERQQELVLAGAHPDVTVFSTDAVIIRIGDLRGLVRSAVLTPSLGRYRILIVEDADRMTESTSNVLLKVLEEPPERTVWMLCAPSEADLLPTIRSRTRVLRLQTPSPEAVADLLVRTEAIDPDLALDCARRTQSHIGMARRLATDPDARARHERSVDLVLSPRSLPQAMDAARDLVDIAKADTEHVIEQEAEARRAEVRHQLGLSEGDRVPPQFRASMREIDEDEKGRRKRAVNDGVDRILTDAQALLRDATMIALRVHDHPLAFESLRGRLVAYADERRPSDLVRGIDAIERARAQLAGNVPPRLVLEGLMASLLPRRRP